MTLQELMPWLVATSTLLSIGTLLNQLLTSAPKANAQKITDLQTEMHAVRTELQAELHAVRSDHGNRLQIVESEVRHLPNKDMIHDLALSIAELKTDIIKWAAATEQSARTSTRVENFLLEHGKR